MTRKLSGAFVLLLLAAPSLAQIEPGDFRVSAGIAGFSYSKLDAEGTDIEQTTFGLTPGGSVRLGYAVNEMIEVGLDVSAQYNKLDIEGDDADAWSVGAGPYIGANFAVNEARTIVMGPSLSLGYNHLGSDLADLDLFQVVLGGELKAFVAKNASIDVGVFFAYATGNADVDSSGDYDVDGFSVGPRVSISIWP